MLLGSGFACLFLLCHVAQAKTAESFVGSSGCRAELQSEGAQFGLALDGKQNVNAEVRKISGKPTMLVVQYSGEKDSCGTVKDIVVAPASKDVFEFECNDEADPRRVVIGTHPDGPFARSWKASKAWTVDFERLKLTPTSDPVTCINYSYAGSDDGSDVRTRSANRAKQKSH
jgi:hypothetical protein